MKTILTTLHSKYIHPSLALPYLAAYCSDADCGEIIISEFTIHEPRENILAELMTAEPDVIAFSVYLWNRCATLELVDALHVINPQLRIILGGPEISFEEEEIWHQHHGLTAIIRGEGEQPLCSLLQQWHRDSSVTSIPRITLRTDSGIIDGGNSEPLANLDDIPSPFSTALMDCSRGFVYYETSRGCPYRCVFCMSALDNQVRSFSMPRIEQDLLWLMEHEIPKIKLVDRTFNYDPQRALHIFQFIRTHNRCSHFHFEIGAHLLDQNTLAFLQTIPEGMFQFEIGIQSVLPATLKKIKRTAPLELLINNISQLLQHSDIHIHLDLIAGLPGEDFSQMLHGIDRVMLLNPQHLQIETVKILPGAPLKKQAAELGICFDPNPPYRTLRTADMSFSELERVRGISRLLDITWNSNRGRNFVAALGKHFDSMANAIANLEEYWRKEGLLRFPLAQKELFEHLASFLQRTIADPDGNKLVDILARDYALSERLTINNAPSFFHTELSPADQLRVKQHTHEQIEAIKGKGIKLQHLAVYFQHLNTAAERQIHLFYYLSSTGEKMRVLEHILPTQQDD
jgi:anaerobic magnesium-protoporphyrin IX monomethyl ester cyclase